MYPLLAGVKKKGEHNIGNGNEKRTSFLSLRIHFFEKRKSEEQSKVLHINPYFSNSERI